MSGFEGGKSGTVMHCALASQLSSLCTGTPDTVSYTASEECINLISGHWQPRFGLGCSM